jgi:hypothetical protein
MKKGNGGSTFLMILFFVLLVLISVYLFAPGLLTRNPLGTGRNAASNFIIDLIKPITASLSGIANSISNFFSGFHIGGF